MMKKVMSKSLLKHLCVVGPLIGLSAQFCHQTSASQKLLDHNNTPKNYFDHGAFMIPHPEKAHRGGEDAYYSGPQILAVADGVGGWITHGINPAFYSRKLCTGIEDIFNNFQKKIGAQSADSAERKALIEEYQSSLENPELYLKETWARNQEKGSSTLVLVTLSEKKKQVFSSLMGDSCYMVLRVGVDSKVEQKHLSPSHQREFNFPYQLGWGRNGDHPDVCQNDQQDIENGDVIVVGSDGLFDNLYPKDIIKITQDHVAQNMANNTNLVNPNGLAKQIAEVAFEYSLKEDYFSPFSADAEKHRKRFLGGKSDDITVVVGRVILGAQ